MKRRREHDPGIEHEPHFHNSAAEVDPSERKAQQLLQGGDVADDAAVHSVHDELAIFPADHDDSPVIDRDFSCPYCGYNLRTRRVGQPCPECGKRTAIRPSPVDKPGYAQWLLRKRMETTSERSWLVTMLLVLLGGPWAILGAFMNPGPGGGVLAIVVFGPVVEEMMKIAAAATLVETRPYLFRNRAQLRVAMVGSALAFAVIENIIYLMVYISNPSLMMVFWRWTVCILLHVVATAIASEGVIRVWQKHESELDPPRITEALPWAVAAIVLHGVYNATMTAAALAGFEF